MESWAQVAPFVATSQPFMLEARVDPLAAATEHQAAMASVERARDEVLGHLKNWRGRVDFDMASGCYRIHVAPASIAPRRVGMVVGQLAAAFIAATVSQLVRRHGRH